MIHFFSVIHLVLRQCVLKICNKFTGEHPCRSVISIKLFCNFTEITLRHGCSPINLIHIFRTLFSGGLILQFIFLFFQCFDPVFHFFDSVIKSICKIMKLILDVALCHTYILLLETCRFQNNFRNLYFPMILSLFRQPEAAI